MNVRKLEQALRNAEFEPDAERAWRWTSDALGVRAVVKFELLADDDEVGHGETLVFRECDFLGAVNLRGTGFASRDVCASEDHSPCGRP